MFLINDFILRKLLLSLLTVLALPNAVYGGIPESKTEEKARFKLQFSKEIIVKNFIRFKKWIDF